MSGHDYLRPMFPGHRNKPHQADEEVGVQAGFWLVEDYDICWADREQRCSKEQEPKLTVGKLSRSHWAKQVARAQLDLESSGRWLLHDLELSTAQSEVEAFRQCLVIAVELDRLERRSEVRSIVIDSERSRPRSGLTNWRVIVSPKLVVEAHTSQGLARQHQFGVADRVDQLGKHGFRFTEGRRKGHSVPLVVSKEGGRSVALEHLRGRTVRKMIPEAFHGNDRVEGERQATVTVSSSERRQADLVRELFDVN
jgi:hypothetical protein